jgi:outer membrane protein insertion porin family
VKQSASVNFVEPWLFNVRWSAGVSLSVSHQTVQKVLQDILPPVFGDSQSDISAPDPFTSLEEYQQFQRNGGTIPSQYLMSYDSVNVGLGVNSGYKWQIPGGFLGVRGSLSSRFLTITYDPTLYRPWDATVRRNLNTWNIIDQLSATVFLDWRDYPMAPSSGFLLSQAFTYTGGLLFGSRHYNRTDTVVESFFTLLNTPVTDVWNLQFVLAAHTGLSLLLPQFAYTIPFGATTAEWNVYQPITDPTDLIMIDGMSTARGWGQSTGQALWDNKLEIRMPIAKEALWVVGFFDAAALWRTPSEMLNADIGQFLFSFGVGLRFTITQFPIRIYLGKRFQIQNGGVQWKTGALGDPNGLNFDFIVSFGMDNF